MFLEFSPFKRYIDTYKAQKILIRKVIWALSALIVNLKLTIISIAYHKFYCVLSLGYMRLTMHFYILSDLHLKAQVEAYKTSQRIKRL